MRVLLSTIGSRGDVQPMVALGLALKSLGEEVQLCVPPDFRKWIESFELSVISIGPEVRQTARTDSFIKLTAEQRQSMIADTIATQFETLTVAARNCDVIVGATALQIAAPSVAEKVGVPYVFTAYCPIVVPSKYHAPPVLTALNNSSFSSQSDYSDLWYRDAQRWNLMWRDLLNSHRMALGLTPIDDVRSYVLTSRPWLAADANLAPWPKTEDQVFQTGAWILDDQSPLSDELETFLQAGESPIYFGFGSMRAPQDINRIVIDAARSLGYRVITSRGWAELALIDDLPDCISIGEVNQQALFKRVAAVVHHGGAGTTTNAAKAGMPQVVIPQFYDQHYWARRVHDLGIGVVHASNELTCDSLCNALHHALQSKIAENAKLLSNKISDDGAYIAARALQRFRV